MQNLLTRRLDDIRLAAMILTRLPMGRTPLSSDATLGRAVWAYPLMGAMMGGISAGAFELASLAGFRGGVAAAMALVVSALLTGCLHEDGLSDFADGLGGGRDRARKLEIMRDSRIGAYGAVALILCFLLRWSAIAALPVPGMLLTIWIAAGALSRGAVALPLMLLPAARVDGLGAQAASVPLWSGIGAVLIAAGIAIFALHAHSLSMIATGTVAALVVTALAWRHLQGHTGDVLGACALITETACLAVATTGWF